MKSEIRIVTTKLITHNGESMIIARDSKYNQIKQVVQHTDRDIHWAAASALFSGTILESMNTPEGYIYVVEKVEGQE